MTTEGRFSLDSLQRWMQTVITHPQVVDSGIVSAEARETIDVIPEQLETVISRSKALTAAERLAIYNRAYFARLIECLTAEYPVFAAAVGEDTFGSFALSYL